jgi:hypothetical protein
VKHACIGLVLVLADGCAAEAARASPEQLPRVDSTSIYGDPALVPTPEGEHARQELAYAGDLQRVLPIDHSQVIVRMPRADESRTTVLVEGILRAGYEREAVETEITSSARAVVGQNARVEVILRAPRAIPTRRPLTDPLLWLAFLGLGGSLALAHERRK